MGWSCSKKAKDIMERLLSLHNENGLIEYNGKYYFLDTLDKEYDDGGVVMCVFHVIGCPHLDNAECIHKGNFTIQPDGAIPSWVFERYPFLKRIEDS